MVESTQASTPGATSVRFGTAQGRWILVGMILGSGIVSLDATVVNVALPRLADDLGADFAGLQWVVNAYTLTLASLILIGGALGDRLGRRRIFVIGVIWFALASVLCGVAPNIETLIAARALQGVGGAMLTPGSLAIIQASFHPNDRARAIGAWSGFGGVTAAIGPFVGGYLIDAASWRWVFLINLPLSALVIWVAIRHVPESRDPSATGRLDVPGAVIGAVGLAATTWGLIARSWPLGIAGLIALVAFVVVERRSRNPMLPVAIFRSRQFTSANIVTFFVYGGLGAVLFMIGLVLQESMGYSPLAAGASLFPITVIMLAFSARSGALAQRIGPRWQMTFGPLTIACGLLLMTRIEPGESYVSAVLPAVVVFASGLALTVAPLTATVLAAASAEHAGIASGVNNAVARVGGLLAVAAVPIVAGFDPAGVITASELVDGFHTTLTAAAILVALGGLIAWTGIRSTLLASATPDDPTPIKDREPCFHCGTDGPPLVVHGGCSAREDGRMRYRRLGKTALQVSELCLGTMNFGPQTSEPDSHAVMDRALDLGINFFDTANRYGGDKGVGATEEIVGRWLAQGGERREKVVLATKLFGPMTSWPNDGRLSARHIRAACDASLRRLQTDHIDLYQMHHIDRTAPWEEVWSAMDVLVQQGKVIYVGSSNFAGWHIVQANERAAARHSLGLVSEQSHYNLLVRTVELEVLPACREYGVGVIPWSPLSGGVLGGVLGNDNTARRQSEQAVRRIEKLRPKLEKWEAFCAEMGEEPAAVALAWLLHQDGVTCPIIGPRTMDQLDGASLRALDLTLDTEALNEIDAIFPGPGGTAPEAYAW